MAWPPQQQQQPFPNLSADSAPQYWSMRAPASAAPVTPKWFGNTVDSCPFWRPFSTYRGGQLDVAPSPLPTSIPADRGDLVAHPMRRQACVRVPVISPFFCHPLFAQVVDCAAGSVLRSPDLRHRVRVRPPPRVESTRPRDSPRNVVRRRGRWGIKRVGIHLSHGGTPFDPLC